MWYGNSWIASIYLTNEFFYGFISKCLNLSFRLEEQIGSNDWGNAGSGRSKWASETSATSYFCNQSWHAIQQWYFDPSRSKIIASCSTQSPSSPSNFHAQQSLFSLIVLSSKGIRGRKSITNGMSSVGRNKKKRWMTLYKHVFNCLTAVTRK